MEEGEVTFAELLSMSMLRSSLVLLALSTSGLARAGEALPVRDISSDVASRRLLARHPVFASLTTSPRRIEHVPEVIESLDLTHVTKVLVVLRSTRASDDLVTNYVLARSGIRRRVINNRYFNRKRPRGATRRAPRRRR